MPFSDSTQKPCVAAEHAVFGRQVGAVFGTPEHPDEVPEKGRLSYLTKSPVRKQYVPWRSHSIANIPRPGDRVAVEIQETGKNSRRAEQRNF